MERWGIREGGGQGMFPTPRVAMALAVAVALAIFIVDTATPSRFGVAVLYVIVVLLAGSFCRRRGIILVAAGCAALTLLSFALTHGVVDDRNAVLRGVMGLAAIAITTMLVLRNERVTALLAERASLLDLTHDTVSVRDMNDIITYWNRGAEELYGWRREDAVGQVLHSLLRTVFPAPLEDIVDELLRTGCWEGELVHTHRDGTRLDMASRWHLRRDRQGQPISILETNNDIADRKRAEIAALRHQEELQLTIDSIPVPVCSALPDGTLDFANARWEETGFSKASILRDWQSLTHPEDRGRAQVIRESAWQEGEPYEVELRLRRKDGSYRWHLVRAVPHRDEAGAITKWYVASFDIEDRKRAEQALIRNQIYLTEAQRLSRTGSFAWKPTSGEIVWSAEACRMWQLDPAQKPTLEFIFSRVHPDDGAAFRCELERAMRGAERFDFGHRCIMADGSVSYIHAVARARTDDAGELEYLGAMVDVTSAREAEHALQKAQAELAHVTRLTTLGELTASIAHEVNQPLAGVVTHGEACLRWLNRPEPQLDEVRQAVTRMIDDGRRASDVIRKLRALSKRAEVQPEPEDLDEILEDTLTLVQRELSVHRVTLGFEHGMERPFVLVDRVHLQQVVINLVLNAIQAMDAIVDRPRELRVCTAEEGPDQVRIEVRDNGGGIDPADRDRLFNPFFTTKADGLGMGLSISRSIVEAHGGRIWVSGHDGPGVSVHVTLPMAPVATQ